MLLRGKGRSSHRVPRCKTATTLPGPGLGGLTFWSRPHGVLEWKFYGWHEKKRRGQGCHAEGEDVGTAK